MQLCDAVVMAGAAVTVVGLEAGEAQAVNDDLDPAGSYTGATLQTLSRSGHHAR